MAAVLHLLRHRSRPLSWIALLAIFGLVFVPTISRALSHGSAGSWAEVCTPQGTKLVAVDDLSGESQPAGSGEISLGHLDHCPLCGLGASAALPPPAASALVLASPLGQAVPRLFLQAPRLPFAWRTPAPRGPPTQA